MMKKKMKSGKIKSKVKDYVSSVLTKGSEANRLEYIRRKSRSVLNGNTKLGRIIKRWNQIGPNKKKVFFVLVELNPSNKYPKARVQFFRMAGNKNWQLNNLMMDFKAASKKKVSKPKKRKGSKPKKRKYSKPDDQNWRIVEYSPASGMEMGTSDIFKNFSDAMDSFKDLVRSDYAGNYSLQRWDGTSWDHEIYHDGDTADTLEKIDEFAEMYKEQQDLWGKEIAGY
jgi:hypothetical protein